MSSESWTRGPSPDVPALTIRWEGLVIVLDAVTLNAVVRRATRSIPEIRQILIEPESGRLNVTARVRKGISVPLRLHMTSLRLKDGFLGFYLEEARAFKFLRFPKWILRRVVEKLPEGMAFYYPEDRVFVLNLSSLLPADLTLHIREVVCENGEMRFIFGPSQYRLNNFFADIESDPFELD